MDEMEKTKKRQIFEKAHAEFTQWFEIHDRDRDVFLLAEKIKDFIEQNPHREVGLSAFLTMSAMAAVYAGISASESPENTVGGCVFAAVYHAGRFSERAA
jgi:hypothetical protein